MLFTVGVWWLCIRYLRNFFSISELFIVSYNFLLKLINYWSLSACKIIAGRPTSIRITELLNNSSLIYLFHSFWTAEINSRALHKCLIRVKGRNTHDRFEFLFKSLNNESVHHRTRFFYNIFGTKFIVGIKSFELRNSIDFSISIASIYLLVQQKLFLILK